MSYVQPNSIIQLFKGINLDNRYMHTIYFASVSAQNSWFSSKVSNTFNAQSYTRYTKNQVKLKTDATSIMDCTYLRFMNDRTADMWYYAFINSVEYVNENTALVTYEIDVMQTWFIQKGTVRPCMVRREHSANDTIYSNLETEPIGSDSYQYDFISNADSGGHHLFDSKKLIINTSGEPASDQDKFVDGMFVGTKFRELNCNSSADVSTIMTTLSDLIGDWDEGEQREQIIDLYTVPEAVTTNNDLISVKMGHKSFNGYVPKNKKLFSYPYCYLYCTTYNGQSSMYRWEYFGEFLTPETPPSDNASFRLYGTKLGGGVVMCYPEVYAGVVDNKEAAIIMDNFPKNSFVYDAYQAWLAAGGSTKASDAEKIVNMKGVATIVSDVSSLINTGVQSEAGIESALTPPMVAGANAVIQGSAKIMSDVASIKEAKNKINYQWKDAQYRPNEVVGKSVPSLAIGKNFLNFYFFNVHVKDSEMKRLDDFFTTFGYATNQVKAPNLTGRQYWNFVQTENCVIAGNMPASSKEAIARIFDGGITFWHNGDNIGNYAISTSNGTINNPIVS